MTEVIHSKRLDLISMTPAFLRASLAKDIRTAEHELKLLLPANWPEDDHINVLRLRLQQIEVDATFQPWSLRAMTLRDNHKMIGHIGFHTAPGADYLKPYAPEAVEFGFTTFPTFRRQGFAREASIALMHWAHRTHGVTKFLVSIRPDNVASQALAAQLGFTCIGSHIDEVDGPEDVLLRDVSSQNVLA